LIEVSITNEQIDVAERKSKEMGIIRNSIRKGEGNFVGFLGEAIVSDYFGGIHANTYDYDVIIKDKKVDVKTKKTTVVPLPEYLCTVADFNTKQKCDYYYFVRINISTMKGYLLGGLTKNAFYKKAKFYKKGELDPISDLGWTFTADCYNVPISELKEHKTNAI
jgi:hypothetical protein